MFGINSFVFCLGSWFQVIGLLSYWVIKLLGCFGFRVAGFGFRVNNPELLTLVLALDSWFSVPSYWVI